VHTLTFQVENGRIAIDVPTDLPDGAEVEILVLDDGLSAQHQAALHVSLDQAQDDAEATRWVDANEFLQWRARCR
jgi:hypothetical protein